MKNLYGNLRWWSELFNKRDGTEMNYGQSKLKRKIKVDDLLSYRVKVKNYEGHFKYLQFFQECLASR